MNSALDVMDAHSACEMMKLAGGYLVFVERSVLYGEHEQRGQYLLQELRTGIQMAQQVEAWLAALVEEGVTT